MTRALLFNQAGVLFGGNGALSAGTQLYNMRLHDIEKKIIGAVNHSNLRFDVASVKNSKNIKVSASIPRGSWSCEISVNSSENNSSSLSHQIKSKLQDKTIKKFLLLACGRNKKVYRPSVVVGQLTLKESPETWEKGKYFFKNYPELDSLLGNKVSWHKNTSFSGVGKPIRDFFAAMGTFHDGIVLG